jgi:hypothetical protein
VEDGTIRARYEKLTGERTFYLREAYRSALVTLPALVPDEQDIRDRTNDVELAKPFQSLGARGVNNLASKLLMTLFPPTSPFLRYEIILGEDEADDVALREQIQGHLARREAAIQRQVDTSGTRVKLFLALKHLLVAGNTLIYIEPEGTIQVFPLNAYVVKRDTIGNPVEVVYVEAMDRSTVQDERVLKALKDAPEAAQGGPDSAGDEPVHVYTKLSWEGKRLHASKEVAGLIFEEQSFKAEESPWLALRFTTIDGEDYGRGFVEEYRGDLTSYEELSRALIFSAANAAMMIPLVHPNGSVKLKSFQNAQNGEAIVGRPEDVTFVTANKFADMQVAQATANNLAQALAADFMLNQSFQRQAERVTKEEIQRMAEELEDTLGGTFSVLSQELQLPLALRYEKQLERDGTLKKLPEGSTRLAVVTGLAAIGRGHDLARLREFLAQVMEIAVAFPQITDYLPEGVILRRIEQGTGIEPLGLKRDDEVAQERAAAKKEAQSTMQRAQLMDKVAGPLAKGFADANAGDPAAAIGALTGGAGGGGAPTPQQGS